MAVATVTRGAPFLLGLDTLVRDAGLAERKHVGGKAMRLAWLRRHGFGAADRMPVAPQHLAHGRPRADFGEEFVFLLAEHERALVTAGVLRYRGRYGTASGLSSAASTSRSAIARAARISRDSANSSGASWLK